jgi:hypothetical protein
MNSLFAFFQNDFPPPVSQNYLSGDLWSYIGSLLMWAAIFGVIFTGIFLILKLAGKPMDLSRFAAVFSPFVLPLLWLYGIIFDPYANINVAGSIGFFKAWFRLRGKSELFEENHLQALLVLVGLNLLVLGISYQISKQISTKIIENKFLPYIAFPFWIISGLFSSNFPFFVSDDVIHGQRLDSIKVLAVCLVAGSIFGVTANLLVKGAITEAETQTNAANLKPLRITVFISISFAAISLLAILYPNQAVKNFFGNNEFLMRLESWMGLLIISALVILWNGNKYGYYLTALLFILNGILLFYYLASLLGILGLLYLGILYLTGLHSFQSNDE